MIMKYICNILYLLIGFILIWTTHTYVQDGDVCRTIFGCFAMWVWFWCKNR